MKLDSITRIERFMANALLSSPLVPLGVNVLRLADVSDEEGILQMANSMVVRYVSSSEEIERQAPLTILRTMAFEVNIASQSYLSQSGHDFAVQLCCASHETLTNTVPPNTGLEVFAPFRMVSEQFTGLTDSTHYTYTQRWEIIIQDMHRAIAIDPCVQRGDCTRLFPQNVKARLMPGETVCGTMIYAPVLPPPNNTIPYDPQYAGVELNTDGDLVYTFSPKQVFMTSEEIEAGYYRVCTGTKDQSNTFEIINIHKPDGTYDRFFFGADTGNRLMMIEGGLVRVNDSTPGVGPNQDNVEGFTAADMPRNGYGFVSALRSAYLYKDPTEPAAERFSVPYGSVFPTADGVTLTFQNTLYLLVGSTPIGRAWIRSEDFTLFRPDEYLPRLDCEEDILEEGNITSCD